MNMSHKKQNVVTAELFIGKSSGMTEHEHLLEHMRFLEERTSRLETKVDTLRELFIFLLDDDEDDEDDDEDEWEDEDD